MTGLNYYDLLKRPEINLEFIENFITLDYPTEVKEQVEIKAKYDGYIKKAYKEVEKLAKLEEKQIPHSTHTHTKRERERQTDRENVHILSLPTRKKENWLFKKKTLQAKVWI